MKLSRLLRSLAACATLAGIAWLLARGTAASPATSDLTPDAIGWVQAPELVEDAASAGARGRSEIAAPTAAPEIVGAAWPDGIGGIQRVDNRWWSLGRLIPRVGGGDNRSPQQRTQSQPTRIPEPSTAGGLSPQPDPRYRAPGRFPDTGVVTAQPAPYDEPVISRSHPADTVDRGTVPMNPAPIALPPTAPPALGDLAPVRRRGAQPHRTSPAAPAVPERLPEIGASPATIRPAPITLPELAAPADLQPALVPQEKPVPDAVNVDPPPLPSTPTFPLVERPTSDEPESTIGRLPLREESAVPGPLLFAPSPATSVTLQPVPQEPVRDVVREPIEQPQRAPRTAERENPPPRPPSPQSVASVPPPQFQPPPEYDPSRFPPQAAPRRTAPPLQTPAPDARSRNQNSSRMSDSFRMFFPLIRR